MSIDPEVLKDRIDAAVERGELTDKEARDEWLAAREEAMYEAEEQWR